MTFDFLRSFRIAGYAIFDLAVSLIGIYLLSPLLSKLFLIFRLKISKLSWVFFTLPLSVLIHFLVGNITPMTKNFFDLNSNYALKAVIIALFILGARGVKIRKNNHHK